MSIKYISTTALAKEIKLQVKDVFKILSDSGLVIRDENNWILTEEGKRKGGIIKEHPRFGSYIAWGEEIKIDPIFIMKEETKKLITSTALGVQFGISKFRINPILSELGLVEKAIKGWNVTSLGINFGGEQFEYDKTGIPYVCWDERILTNKRFVDSIKEIQGETIIKTSQDDTENLDLGFRGKFEAKHRSADGHYVRSRAEMLIDNWLYMSEIVHAYERRLPIEEEVYCDFYLPVGKVYIEFWGLENDEKYLNRKIEKLRIYEKYGFNLIELVDTDIQNLDDLLPKKLLKFGIQTY